MSNLTKSMEAGDRDTVVEKLLAIFPAMDREVARSVLITCEYDLAQTVETLKELGIHKVKESATSGESPAGAHHPAADLGGRRGSSGSINIPNSPTRGSSGGGRNSPSTASPKGPSPRRGHTAAVASHTSHAHSHARSPSTYTFGTSPVSNAYFADHYQDDGILTHPRGQSPINPYLTATGGIGRPSAASPNPYLPPNNPYLVPPGAPSGMGFGGPASPSSRPSFYAYSYSSSPGSVYPIHSQAPSLSSPSLGPFGGGGGSGGGSSAWGQGHSGSGSSGSSNPYVFSSSPKFAHGQQFPPAGALSGSPNPFYTYSYSSSPGSVYPIASVQPSARHPTFGGGFSGSPSVPPHGQLSQSPGTAYFASLAATSPAGGRFGGPSSPSSAGGPSPLMFRKEPLHSSLDNLLLAKAIKIEDESESESESDEGEEREGEEEEESVGDNEVVFADEDGFDAVKAAVQQSSPSQKKKKPTIIILRPKQSKSPHHSPSEGNKHQMPNLAQRKFMRMVFKNRTDVSPLNPLAALFLCLSQVPALRDYFLSDAYKAQLKPEKNKSAGADSVHAAEASMGDLNISGEWDAQDVYHGSRRLTLAQHFALCVKALQGKTPNELRELDEQFAAFQQVVTSRTPHLSGTGSVEEEAGRYSDMVDWVLEHLKEDLSVKSPAYEPTPEDEALGDDHVAAKYWESYKRANPILIANLFTGLLKTAISCTGCGHRTVSVSVANGLVLPTSLDKKRSIVVTFVPDNPSATNKPTKHSVSVFKTSYGQDLKVGLIERLGKPLRPDQLIVTEVYGGRIAQIIDDSTPVEVLKDKDVVVVYEVPAAHQSAQTRRRMSFPFDKASSPVVGAKSDLPFFVIHRYHKQRKEDDMGTHIIGKPFPVPSNLTYAQLYTIVWERFKETLGYSKDLSYAELADQIRESEEKRLAGEKDAKGREDKKGHHADSKRHVGPFEIKIVDQFLANCGSCDKGFRCDGCVMPYDEVPVSFAPENHLVVDWNIPSDEYESKLHKSLLLNMWPDKLEETGGVAPKVTLQDCLHKYIGQYRIPEWFCQHCKEFKQATKATAIGELPPSLMIHLSRFELNRYWHRVCKTEVDFPISGLDLTSYVEETVDGCSEHQPHHGHKKILYDLQAVLQLSGSRGYSACVRNPGDRRFYHYTPSATYQLPSEESDLPSLKSILCSGDACVLFYAKREDQAHSN